VFLKDGAEQECSGYILSSASFLPGTLNPIQNRLETNGFFDAAFLSTDADGAKWCIGNIPELVLGGGRGEPSAEAVGCYRVAASTNTSFSVKPLSLFSGSVGRWGLSSGLWTGVFRFGCGWGGVQWHASIWRGYCGVGFDAVNGECQQGQQLGDITFHKLGQLPDAAAKFIGLLPCFDGPATDIGHLLLSQFQITRGLFEILLFLDAGGPEITDAAHLALMQTDTSGVEFLQAAFGFPLPEPRPILFQPHQNLSHLSIECCDAGAGFFLERDDCGGEFADRVG